MIVLDHRILFRLAIPIPERRFRLSRKCKTISRNKPGCVRNDWSKKNSLAAGL